MTKKILMLHGLGQTGDYFQSKTHGFRTALEELGYELYYPTAPHRYPAANLPDDLQSTLDPTMKSAEVVAWLQNDLVNGTYILPQMTIDFLHDYIVENGPFEGVVGFSQGAGVAGYLLTDINSLLHLTPEEQPPLQFFMAFSGFRLIPECFQRQYNENPITIPSLHVQGELDTITDSKKVRALYDCCDESNRTLLTHAGGHFVPNSRGFLKKVVEWLNST